MMRSYKMKHFHLILILFFLISSFSIIAYYMYILSFDYVVRNRLSCLQEMAVKNFKQEWQDIICLLKGRWFVLRGLARSFELTVINGFFGASVSLVLPPTELEDCAVLCWMLPIGCQASEFKSIFEGKTKTTNVCLSWSGFTAKHFVLLTAPFSRAFSSILKSKLPSCKETPQSFNGSSE